MYKNKMLDGKCNVSGPMIRKLRLELPVKTSQRALADMLQLQGVDVDKNAIQRMESGQRFITDIELKALAHVLNVSADQLLNNDNCSE